MKKITIVTINYNSEDSTRKFLESIKQAGNLRFELEIIVVDNGSSKVFKANKNELVLRSDNNNGFAGGCNIGMKEALKRHADYILLINNDTTVESELVTQLIEVLDSDENIGAVVPKIYFSKGQEFHKEKYKKEELGRVIWFAGGFIDWQNAKSVHRGMDEVDHGQYNKVEKTGFATGCCVLIKREVLEKVGFFDERYFLYYEDSDLSERIKRAGYEIYYAPEAIVYHDNAASSGGSGSGLHDYFLTRNQMFFGMHYAPFKTKIALFRQGLRLLLTGRKYQKLGIMDFYLNKMGKGRFFDQA